MKELSIEQKARRYDEAIERAQEINNEHKAQPFDVMLKVFPELIDEDEMIMKEILQSIKDNMIVIHKDKCIAWLEKQLKVKEAMRDVEQKAKAFTEANKGLTSDEILAQMRGEGWNENESAGEQKIEVNTEELSDFERSLKHIIEEAIEGGDTHNLKADADMLLRLAQNHAWSEEDENGLGDALWAIQQARTIAKDENDMGNLWYAEHWLKSLKVRAGCEVNCTTTKEWSEEDSTKMQRIIDFLWYNRKGDTDTIYQQEQDIEWLKSLKDRYTWKPSEEIMKGLNEIINKLAISPVIHEHGYLYDLMVNLRKKLKGE